MILICCCSPGSQGIGGLEHELRSPPDLSVMRDAITILRELRKEEFIDLVYYGGTRLWY